MLEPRPLTPTAVSFLPTTTPGLHFHQPQEIPKCPIAPRGCCVIGLQVLAQECPLPVPVTHTMDLTDHEGATAKHPTLPWFLPVGCPILHGSSRISRCGPNLPSASFAAIGC
jgi:hypothetical protein